MKARTCLFRVVPLSAVALAGAAFIVACSSDSTPGTSSGRTGGDPDAAPDAAPEAAPAVDSGGDGASGGTKEIGDTCAGDGECKSGHCLTQGAGGGGGGGDGGGGGRAGSFCSVTCATVNQNPAPECSGPLFTGKCGGKLLCQIK
jgi:hypothetical protein